MSYTEKFTEVHKLLISENSPALVAGTYDSPWVSLMNYHRAVAILHVLDMGAGATLDFSIRQATTTAGANAKVITNTAGATTHAITQLTQADGDVDSDVIIELRTAQLDVTNGFDCISVRTVVGVDTCVISYHVFGIIPRFPPVGVAEWTEVVYPA